MKHFSIAFLLSALLLASIQMQGASTRPDDAYRNYIDTYAEVATENMNRYGIPASVTLAQGILESAAGRSRLAREGNNHFGIKCHTEWTGDTMLRNDDAPNECFRVYSSADESFTDHSKFLKRKRYAPLFELDINDYRGWCQGLKDCGYATDPNYTQRLITIIERYALYAYDTGIGPQAAETAEFIFSMLQQTHPIRKSRGLHYVIASPGDTYESIAKELGTDPTRLAEYNDATDITAPIREWEEVYLVEKLEDAPKGEKRATIGEGETMRTVAQRYGMKLSALQALNPTAPDIEGTRLKLR